MPGPSLILLSVLLNSLSNGGVYLFQASDDEKKIQWVNAINTVAGFRGCVRGGATRAMAPNVFGSLLN